VFLIGTMRTGEPVPGPVSALWRGGRMACIDLVEMSRNGVENFCPRRSAAVP
jgi:hypothetical protein